eukprot:CAMPEP_0170745570 /NCGR_PEP_ID=MMETSP0437-20130122/8361_1 /TAXON_ID=0 /ORGANISM="Sexangularia sp." /LENGTH=529 /DNA_ID=CAMNT_0011084293 /DNA_START=113 /DNA_END=1698 /DNA_ORIENTATION=-
MDPSSGEFVPGSSAAVQVDFTEPVAEPVAEPAAEPVAEPAAEPAAEPDQSGPTQEEIDAARLQLAAERREEAKAAEARAAERADAAAAHEAELDEADIDEREHLNVVFIGHVDAGKSTISGQVLLSTGQVDDRTVEKYQREAEEKKHASWFLAYIMDTNEEERAKGKTVEVGRATFETENKRFTVLDAPGHKNYVPNMISGAAQADVGVLVISARRGEFETGFEKGGQTKEHAMLAKTLGVQRLIVVINKMDEETVQWDQGRYDTIQKKLEPFLRGLGYDAKKGDVLFIPLSGLTGVNVKTPLSKDVCPWYDGRPETTLLGALDSLPRIPRDADAGLRIPIMDSFKDRGCITLMGKVEQGTVRVGSKYALAPSGSVVEVLSISTDDDRNVRLALPGESVNVGVKDIEEGEVHPGFVLCDVDDAPAACDKFVAQLRVLDLHAHKQLFTKSYQAVLHIHTAVEEVTVMKLLAQLDRKTGKVKTANPPFVKEGDIVRCILKVARPVCLEKFADLQQLGRFTLRDEGKTIAIG